MKGLELARAYYEEYGAPMMKERFPEYESLVAVGLVGAGSECFGYDDDCSHDHDFEPGFCLFLPDEDLIDSRAAFALERAYAKLPKEYMGFERLPSPPAGGNRRGVVRISDFYREKTGSPDGALTVGEWFSLPDFYLAEATNGEVFRDDLGLFSRIRARLLDMPQDVRFKKLAGRLWSACQCAPYNYERCLVHGERAAAKWALYEFVDHVSAAVFLINGAHRPFFKWRFRAMRGLPKLSDVAPDLEALLFGDQGERNEEKAAALVGKISTALTACLEKDGLLPRAPLDLAGAAFEINDLITDNHIRNMNILCGV